VVDAARPLVSLVVASRIGGDELMASIESFVRVGDDRFEIIVAEAGATGTAAAVAQRFPEVRVEHFDERRSIPELRAAGIRAARGDIIAMTTGRCRADGMWLTRLRQAHRGTAAAVGGAIEYAGDGRLIDRAVFFCEYGRYVPPFDEGPSVDLPGQNVSYTRAAIEQMASDGRSVGE
jgi:glycosyltransferase involved in cell wall biosynthesis